MREGLEKAGERMKQLKIVICTLAISALFLTTVIQPTRSYSLKGEGLVTFDFESPDHTVYTARVTYFDRSIVDKIRNRARENWQEYYENSKIFYLQRWRRIDNFELTIENLEENTTPLVRTVKVVGDKGLKEVRGVYQYRVQLGEEGYKDTTVFKLPAGYVSVTAPAPKERRVEENREVLVYEAEGELYLSLFFTDNPPTLLTPYIFEKLSLPYMMLILAVFIIITGLGIARGALAWMERKVRSLGREPQVEYPLYLVRIAGLLNALLLFIAALIEISVWSIILFVPGIFIILFSLVPKKMCALLSKAGASLESSRPEHLSAIFLYLNAFWGSVLLLAALSLDSEFQRVIAFASDTSILSLLIGMGAFVMLAFSAVGFRIPFKRKGFKAAVKTKFWAATRRLGLVRPQSYTNEIAYGCLGALALVAVVWPISRVIPVEGVIYEEMLKRMTFLSAVVLSASAGVGEEILFRGALQPRFGLVLTSLLFGILHSTYGFIPHVALAIFGGFVFGFLYRQRQNILAPIVAHSVYNLTVFIILTA